MSLFYSFTELMLLSCVYLVIQYSTAPVVNSGTLIHLFIVSTLLHTQSPMTACFYFAQVQYTELLVVFV